jgi:hypothetical protein
MSIAAIRERERPPIFVKSPATKSVVPLRRTALIPPFAASGHFGSKVRSARR